MSEPSPKPLRANYVLVDYENVQPECFEQLDHEHFVLFVLLGANQAKLPVEMAKTLQRFGDRMKYVTISGHGDNALDFHIAYYIGQLATADPAAYFHIISKDRGYDPLIEHLREKKILARRVETIGDIPLVKIANSKSIAERIDVIIGKLKQPRATKPATVKTLSNMIAAVFRKQLSDEDVSSLIKAMAKKGHFTVSGTKITYVVE